MIGGASRPDMEAFDCIANTGLPQNQVASLGSYFPYLGKLVREASPGKALWGYIPYRGKEIKVPVAYSAQDTMAAILVPPHFWHYK